jgi:hypothetical protein
MSPTQNILTGATKNLITSQSGIYNVPGLPSGNYILSTRFITNPLYNQSGEVQSRVIEDICHKSHRPVSSEIVVGSVRRLSVFRSQRPRSHAAR